MSIATFLSNLEPDRKDIMASMHNIIIETDKTVEASIGTMMRKEMILYHARGMFKYGLSSVKNYMSLHALPIYASPELHEKYLAILNKANFQKGCINFKNGDEMPLAVFKNLIKDTAKIDLVAIREAYLLDKKNAKKKNSPPILS